MRRFTTLFAIYSLIISTTALADGPSSLSDSQVDQFYRNPTLLRTNSTIRCHQGNRDNPICLTGPSLSDFYRKRGIELFHKRLNFIAFISI